MKIKDLKLALSATPKKHDNTRYYLNSILISKTSISASTGHILCYISDMNNFMPDYIESVLVPVDAIKLLLKKIGTKDNDLEVIITNINNRYELSCLNKVEVFEPVDSKYPNFDKFIDEIKANDHDKSITNNPHQFNPEFLYIAYKAIAEYFDKKDIVLRLYNISKCGYFMPAYEYDILYIIMPWRV